MEPGVHIDYGKDSVTYNEFINQELILFSHADNERSLPHFMDGFKPSQRKVLFACFKRNLKQEIKVAQLAGYISEHSAYHHGEASLTQTIIAMAQVCLFICVVVCFVMMLTSPSSYMLSVYNCISWRIIMTHVYNHSYHYS